MAINGYLFDEEFFIDCGAGGGSSSSPNLSDQSENTSNIASQINISNYTGIDCESLNNLNYGDIVFTGQGQSSMVVPGAACGSSPQSSGFLQSNALNTLSSQPWTNYYCFFSVNDTIVLGSIPYTCCMNNGTTSLSIKYYGEYTSEFDPNSTTGISYLNNGAILLPGNIYSLEGGASYTNATPYDMDPLIFNELGVYASNGGVVFWPTNYFAYTYSGIGYYIYGKSLKNF